MKTVLAASALMFLAGAGFAGECVGENLIAALPAEDRAWIRDRAEAVPYHQGILWRAEKGDAWISIVGTYHFDHAMHPDTVARLQPDLAAADRLLVEMGPEEEAQLQAAMLSDPTLIMDPTGPTLPERLSEPQWQEVSAAMEARGVPAVMASRMRPWYLAMLMGFSPCAMQQLTQESALLNGLDKRLMAEAGTIGLPIEALEPWDTVIQMFGNLTPQEAMARAFKWLKYDNVHLAFDPEFAMREPGQEKPGQPPGYVTAQEVNEVQQAMRDYMVENDIPGRRVLILHQFLLSMIKNKEELEQIYKVDMVITADGWGTAWQKLGKYNSFIYDDVEYAGYKLFYRWDDPVMTEAEALGAALHPGHVYMDFTPNVIIYQ